MSKGKCHIQRIERTRYGCGILSTCCTPVWPVAAEPVGQLPEEIVKSIEPIQDFVSISATVAAVPRHRRAPQPVNLTVKFSGGVSASWQKSLEDVGQAAKNVWQQLSEVCYFTWRPCRPNRLSRPTSTTGRLHCVRNRPCTRALKNLLAMQLLESDSLTESTTKATATRCRYICGLSHLTSRLLPYSCLCISALHFPVRPCILLQVLP